MSPQLALAVVAGGIALLLLLVLRFRVSAFFALLVVALGVGIALGASPEAVIESIRDGMGGTVGFVGVVVGLGALFGAMLEAAGGVEAISGALLRVTGEKRAGWALGVAGFVIAIPVFFDVAFILMTPLLYGLVRRTGRSVVYYALPMLAGLAVTHAFIPPTPGPIAVADLLGADLGLVILFGALAAVPAMIVAGPIYAAVAYGRAMGEVPSVAPHHALPAAPRAAPPDVPEEAQDRARPGTRQGSLGAALAITALPLVLVLGGALATTLSLPDGLRAALRFAGHPFSALLIACAAAWLWLTVSLGADRKAVGARLGRALEPAGAIVLVTGAGGAFKQVLVDTGSGAAIADVIAGLGWPPLLFAFAAAAVVRVAQGSATVAMITAASLLAPILESHDLSAPRTALTVIAIASGATLASHVNDSGFWLVSRYLALTEAETLRSWTVASTLLGLVGMATVLVLSLFVA